MGGPQGDGSDKRGIIRGCVWGGFDQLSEEGRTRVDHAIKWMSEEAFNGSG